MATHRSELRQSSRIHLMMPARCHHDGGTAPVLVQDISREGLFLLLTEYVAPGSIRAVELVLPGAHEPLRLPISVRFIGRTLSGFGVGARITEPAALQRWIRFYESALYGAVPRALGSPQVVATTSAAPPRLQEQLQEQGLTLAVARDNRAVLALLGPHGPEVVLAELHDPQLSGVELCRRIRCQPALAGVAVLLVTEREDAADFLTGLRADATFVLARPFSALYCASRILAAARQISTETEPLLATGSGPSHAPAESSGVHFQYLHTPSPLPDSVLHLVDRISDAYFFAKHAARQRLRRYRRLFHS